MSERKTPPTGNEKLSKYFHFITFLVAIKHPFSFALNTFSSITSKKREKT